MGYQSYMTLSSRFVRSPGKITNPPSLVAGGVFLCTYPFALRVIKGVLGHDLCLVLISHLHFSKKGYSGLLPQERCSYHPSGRTISPAGSHGKSLCRAASTSRSSRRSSGPVRMSRATSKATVFASLPPRASQFARKSRSATCGSNAAVDLISTV